MNDKQKAKWEITRAKGKWQFILIKGLSWGVFVAVFGLIAEIFLLSKDFNSQLQRLPSALIIFLVAGFIWAWLLWMITELDYKRSNYRAAIQK